MSQALFRLFNYCSEMNVLEWLGGTFMFGLDLWNLEEMES